MKEIELTQNKTTIVDNEDYEKLNQYKWHYDGGYARRNKTISVGRRTGWRMHWDIVGKPEGRLEVDHIDGDGLNNQKSNLRIGTHRQNMQNMSIHKDNKSGYKGVYWHKLLKKWQSSIWINGGHIHLGSFNNKEDAINAINNEMNKRFAVDVVEEVIDGEVIKI